MSVYDAMCHLRDKLEEGTVTGSGAMTDGTSADFSFTHDGAEYTVTVEPRAPAVDSGTTEGAVESAGA